MTGSLREDLTTFMTLSRWILLKMRNVYDESVEILKIHILCSINFFFRKSCRLWDNVEKYGRVGQATDDNIMRRVRTACWITKVTDTHSECVMLIAFPRQQWLRERVSMLRWYVHRLCSFDVINAVTTVSHSLVLCKIISLTCDFISMRCVLTAMRTLAVR
jgi:hypothetical protein